MWGCWRVLGRAAGGVRLCAPQALSTQTARRRTVELMGDTRCVGRGDGTDCPNGEDQVLVDGVRCEECRQFWELDETVPGRRAVEDAELTRPMGDPREAGKESAA